MPSLCSVTPPLVRGVNVFPSQIEERILKQDVLAPHYQLRVSREGQLDILTVKVELTPECVTTDTNEISAALKKDIKDNVGVSSLVEVCGPGEVPRSEGKAVRVIDLRDG